MRRNAIAHLPSLGRVMRSERAYALALAAGLVLLRLSLLEVAGRRVDPTEFGIFLLNRRWVTTLQPLWTLGLSVIIVRWVAQRHLTQRMFVSVARLVVGITAAGVLAGLAVPDITTRFFFGTTQASPFLTVTLAVATGGMAFYTIIQTSLLGLGLAKATHLWPFLVGGVAPLVAVAFWPNPSAMTFILLSLSIDLAASAVMWLFVYRRLPKEGTRKFGWNTGLPQLPGNLGLSLLLNAPTQVATQLLGVVAGGQYAVGTMVIGLVGNLFAAISRKHLTVATRLMQAGRYLYLNALAKRAAIPTIGVACLVLAGLWVGAFAAIDMGIVHSPIRLDASPIILSLGAIPYAAYVALRGFVDGRSDLPLNAKTIFWSAWLFLGGLPFIWFWPNGTTISTMSTLSLISLAGGTYWQASGRRLPFPLPRIVVRYALRAMGRPAAHLGGGGAASTRP